MNELKVKVEVEKELAIPKLTKFDNESDEDCIVDDGIINMDCKEILCEDCICNINNFMLFANSQHK